ncbi:MAG: hypothetical protein AB7P69_09855 [Candidatus Binatia bacterium]
MFSQFHSTYYGWILGGALSPAEMTAWRVLYYPFLAFLAPIPCRRSWDVRVLPWIAHFLLPWSFLAKNMITAAG